MEWNDLSGLQAVMRKESQESECGTTIGTFAFL